jgi:hypothetical protein
MHVDGAGTGRRHQLAADVELVALLHGIVIVVSGADDTPCGFRCRAG